MTAEPTNASKSPQAAIVPANFSILTSLSTLPRSADFAFQPERMNHLARLFANAVPRFGQNNAVFAIGARLLPLGCAFAGRCPKLADVLCLFNHLADPLSKRLVPFRQS